MTLNTLSQDFRPDTWLSTVFGCPVFALTSARGISPDALEALHTAHHGAAFYYAKVDVTETDTVRKLSAAGFYVVDVGVTFGVAAASLRASSPMASSIRVTTDVRGDADVVLDIASSAFRFSRFHLDPLVRPEIANTIKREWIANYIRGARGDVLFVARDNGVPAGFLAALLVGRDGQRVAVIDLVATAPAFQRRGVGRALVAAFLEHYRPVVDRLEVGTQIVNAPSMKLYQQAGMEWARAEYVLHMHCGRPIGMSLRVAAVVQARFASARLPGKVLRLLRGRPMLGYLLESLTHCQSIDGILVATSHEASDDAIEAFARSSCVGCYRGSLHDVAGRLLAAAAADRADAIVRLSGDSPLLDPALVDCAVEMFRADSPDLVSNVVTRTFPKGQSVEVLSRETLAVAVPAMTKPGEREHVTPYFYARPDVFTIRSFEAAHPRPTLQLSVDNLSDFARCEAILKYLRQAPWEAGWEACVRASDALEAGMRS